MDPIPDARIYVERTLVLIKPEAVDRSEEIENIILRSGFTILQKRELQLSLEQSSDFYAGLCGKLFYPDLTTYMSSAPIVALTLGRHNAIAHWKALMGPVIHLEAVDTQPECLRARFGSSDLKNALHGSETFHAAEREIKFMFPNSVIEPFPSREVTEEYLSRFVNPTLLSGLTELCKHKPQNPCLWLADWLVDHCPNKPQLSDGRVEVKESSES